MSNRVRVVLFATLSLCVALAYGASLATAQSTKGETTAQKSAKEDRAAKSKYTNTFPEENYLTIGTNPYYIPLELGRQLVLEGKDGKENVNLQITVCNETEDVGGVTTRVVEEKETIDGELYEVSRNYLAIGERTNGVFYFGEDVDFYENGQVVGHEGTWHHGTDGARFGLLMPGNVLLGSRYYQEIAPRVAKDRAEHVNMGQEVETPFGTFQDTLKVRETTPLEPKVEEFKYYAKDVGLIKDGPLKLTDNRLGGTCL